jgi:hypothetical protein
MRKSLSVAYQPVITSYLDLEDPYVQPIMDNKVGCVDTTYFNGSLCWKDIENTKSSLQGNPPTATVSVNWLDNQTNKIDIRATNFSKTDKKIPSTPFSADVITMQPSCILQFVPQSDQVWQFNFTFDYRNVDLDTLVYVNNLYSGSSTAVTVCFNEVEIYQIDIIESFRIYTHQHLFEWNQADTITVALKDITLDENYSEQQIIYTLRTL